MEDAILVEYIVCDCGDDRQIAADATRCHTGVPLSVPDLIDFSVLSYYFALMTRLYDRKTFLGVFDARKRAFELVLIRYFQD